MMATPANLRFLDAAKLLQSGLSQESLTPNDLVMAVRTDEDTDPDHTLRRFQRLLTEPDSGPARSAALDRPPPRTLAQALAGATTGGAPNLALISVPGPYARGEALKALARGLHVFLFSADVPEQTEVELKRLAGERGLLVMGPDCGTALLHGVGLGFSNAVRRGPIGIVAGSGTGLQEVSCLIDRHGSGVSHAIGTGGRDLSERVGGLTTFSAIELLERDPGTAAIVVISKLPSPDVARQVIERLRQVAKPSVVCLLGYPMTGLDGQIRGVGTLRDAAAAVCELVGTPSPRQESATNERGPGPGDATRAAGWVRGVYAGGTLCSEALAITRARSLRATARVAVAEDGTAEWPADAHTYIDLGAEEYTTGRPHPMIDPRLRNLALGSAARDPRTAALLFDLVIGYGANPDPAGALGETLTAIHRERPDLPVLASVCGTDADPQVRSRQAETLEALGVTVLPSNADAAEAALHAAGAAR